jgi:glycosyltransferase involved in cell wall biosynthesis
MEHDLVSIVVTCFNEEPFIAGAIDSAMQQTYRHVEVVVVDDGSTDGSADIVRSTAPNATLVSKPNGGLSSARNAGLRRASGEYVVFLDGDDRLKPEFVATTIAALQHHPEAAYAYTQLEFFGRECRVTDFPEFSVDRLVEGNYISATSTIRRTAGGDAWFDEKLRKGWEDWDFFLGLAERGLTGVRVDEPLVLYRKHEDRSRMTDRMHEPRSRQETRLRIMRRHLRLFGVRPYVHHLLAYAKMRVTALRPRSHD